AKADTRTNLMKLHLGLVAPPSPRGVASLFGSPDETRLGVTMTFHGRSLLGGVVAGLFACAALSQEVLPRPEAPFKGKIERTVKGSVPDFPKGVEAPKGAPNVLLILTDDVGFGATSTYACPLETPNFQRLANAGLRYNAFHTTALCSPTRSALITGRNHHTNASGVITEMATGYPGYNSLISRGSGSVGEVLRENGYNTSWFGKM